MEPQLRCHWTLEHTDLIPRVLTRSSASSNFISLEAISILVIKHSRFLLRRGFFGSTFISYWLDQKRRLFEWHAPDRDSLSRIFLIYGANVTGPSFSRILNLHRGVHQHMPDGVRLGSISVDGDWQTSASQSYRIRVELRQTRHG